MSRVWLFGVGLVCGAVAMALPRIVAHLRAAVHGGVVMQSSPGSARVHTEEKFAFTARAPMEKVAPLFGADKERVWAPGWEPQFAYPLPAADVPGMVFTVAHGHKKAVWVNTQLDWRTGRVQYAYVIPEAMATLLTLQLAPNGSQTRVEVEYQRTALSAEADEHVRAMAEKDRAAGPEWEKQMNEYLTVENRN